MPLEDLVSFINWDFVEDSFDIEDIAKAAEEFKDNLVPDANAKYDQVCAQPERTWL